MTIDPLTLRFPGSIDADAFRAGLEALWLPGHHYQIAIAPSYRWAVFEGRDFAGALAWVTREGPSSDMVRLTLNPVEYPAAGQATVERVQSRQWLMIDLDPVRPVGESSTEEEKERALDRSSQILADLEGKGWPEPLMIMSGSGVHILYRVDLPNTEYARILQKKVLAHLHREYTGGGVTVDNQTYKATQATKAPGTWVRKGPSTEERPHRRAELLYRPDTLEPVPAVKLLELAGPVEVKPPRPSADPLNPKVKEPTSAALAYGRKALEGELAALAGVTERRNEALNRAAFSVYQLVAGGCLSEVEATAALTAAAERMGLPGSEIRSTLASARAAGFKSPRTPPEKDSSTPPPGQGPTASQKTKADDKAEEPTKGEEKKSYIVRASQITPRPISWLWPGRLPAGKLVTVAGPGGTGKTFALLDVSARVTRGKEWPDGKPGGPPKSVLFVSSEDDPEDTLVPRLIKVGADLDRVAFLTAEVNSDFCLQKMPILRQAAEDLGEVGLVVIDPPTAYLGDVDDHKNAELRRILHPLSIWAQEIGACVVLNTHVNKGGAGQVAAASRVMGSVAWVNAVRAAYLMVRDPDDPTGERRLMAQIKCNLAREPATLAYKILPGEGEEMARVEWLGTVETTADQALRESPQKKREQKAREWLLDAFRRKRRWLGNDLFEAARKAGISRDAVFEAVKGFDPPPIRQPVMTVNDQGKSTKCWVWTVPDDWAPIAEEEGETWEV